jgi:hypothetical protein
VDLCLHGDVSEGGVLDLEGSRESKKESEKWGKRGEKDKQKGKEGEGGEGGVSVRELRVLHGNVN